MITMPVSARIPPNWIAWVEGNRMGIPMPARSSKERELYTVFMEMDTRELLCDCPKGGRNRTCFHILWLIRACTHFVKGRDLKAIGRDTQIQAYYSLAPEVLAEQEKELYLYLRENGPQTDRQIMEGLGWPRHIVTARRNGLMVDGLVDEAGCIVDPVSNVTVHQWEAAVA